MSAIRDKARTLLDGALPSTTIITSNGPLASRYTEMTGLSHKVLTDNWATGGIMTGCNGFTGWYGSRMGSTTYLGVFDLQGVVKKAGRPTAWVPSQKDNRPQYGDILRHASFHVDVCLGFEGDILLRAAGGQGGKNAGCDIIKRVRGTGPYDPAKLNGWIDIDIYFGGGAAAAGDLSWLYGWWTVNDGSLWYYYFSSSGVVQYVTDRPSPTAPAPSHPGNTGKFTYTGPGSLVITWNPAGGASTVETFRDATANATTMNATSNRFSPLVATRLR